MKKIFLVTSMLFSSLSYAGVTDTVKETYQDTKNYIQDEWEKSTTTDVYIPLVIYHNRSSYSQESIDRFNESPWGIGFGKSYRDEKNNWHGFYGMAFKDSHNDFEPIVGYAWVKNLVGDAKSLNAGLGYTVGLTSRSDFNYVPIPIILPIASVGYDKVNVNATYIPGSKGNGNVLFMWSTISF